MLPMTIILDGDGCWPDLATKTVHRAHVAACASLDAGMASGKPSVAFRIDLDDGSVVIAETSLALFLSAADALRARHGDPRR